MNDHIELIVPSKSLLRFRIITAFLVVLAILAGAFMLFTGSMFLLLIAVIAGVLAYMCAQRVDIEYEYSLTMNEMDIDIIYSKQSRKHLITLDLSKMEVCAPLNSYHLDEFKNRNYKTVDYSSCNPYNDAAKYVMYYSGECRYILEPDERMVNAFYSIAPRKVFRD